MSDKPYVIIDGYSTDIEAAVAEYLAQGYKCVGGLVATPPMEHNGATWYSQVMIKGSLEQVYATERKPAHVGGPL